MLKLYNTFGRKLEDFTPLNPPHVGLYTCGPTVYSTAHLGNLRTYIFEDVLKRVLRLNGYDVKHVMNITDVGHLTGDGDMGRDRMEESAKREHRSAWEIAKQYEAEFFTDLAKLNIIKPDVILRATETIELQIDLIKQLEAKGFTYRTSDGLYFDTSKFPAYGQLSGQKASDKHAGARVEVNPEKKNPTDFALWKFSKADEKRQMEWPSPWGVGFPGWHIECSAMSMKELGEQFDIHCGGIDHIAVHHENEIAQSEAATGKNPFVKYWMHGEFLKLPGKRMGKSEGNAILLRDINVPPLAFRYLILQIHYRKILEFSEESLLAAGEGLNRIYAAIDNSEIASLEPTNADQKYLKSFTDSVSNDLNTSKALAIMQKLLSSKLPPSVKSATLQPMDQILGLDLLGARETAWVTPSPEQRERLSLRQMARNNKDWGASDNIRDAFAKEGLEIIDTPSGTRLRKK